MKPSTRIPIRLIPFFAGFASFAVRCDVPGLVFFLRRPNQSSGEWNASYSPSLIGPPTGRIISNLTEKLNCRVTRRKVPELQKTRIGSPGRVQCQLDGALYFMLSSFFATSIIRLAVSCVRSTMPTNCLFELMTGRAPLFNFSISSRTDRLLALEITAYSPGINPGKSLSLWSDCSLGLLRYLAKVW